MKFTSIFFTASAGIFESAQTLALSSIDNAKIKPIILLL